MVNSKTIKLNMPLHVWNDLSKLVKDIKSQNENFNIDLEKYAECKNYGKLYCDFVAASLGALEMIRKPEFYNK